MSTLGRWAAGFLVLVASCSTSDTPSAPVSPPPPAPQPQPEAIRLVPMGFRGPLFQPNVPLRLEPGKRITVPVMTAVRDFGSRDGIPGILIRVRTDAPPTILTVNEEVAVLGSGAPGLVEIHALRSTTGSEPSVTYSIWLEEHPEQRWAPGWGLGLDQRRLRVAVAEAAPPPAPCERLELTGRVAPGTRGGGIRARLTFGPLADDFRSGTITLRADHPETSLSLLSQYRMPYEDLDPESDRARVRYHLYPTAFALGLEFRETTAGFEQTMTLGWFDDVRLRAEAPGCDAVNLSCDDDGRCRVGEPVSATSAAPSRVALAPDSP